MDCRDNSGRSGERPAAEVGGEGAGGNGSGGVGGAAEGDSTRWKTIVAQHSKPVVWRSVWQIVNTLVPFVVLWLLMFQAVKISWWLAPPLMVLTGGFMVRLFIIFHDCGHGSFFVSRRVNDVVGVLTGVLTLTPYYHWRWEHSVHHASAGNLDKRGMGDVWTMTVQEYLESSRWRRFAYRLARNPFVLFVLAPLGLFLIKQRVPSRGAAPRERRSVYWTNLGILVVACSLGWGFGFTTYLILQAGVVLVAGAAGVWLFYVQHQFEGVYWERHGNWDYVTAALRGSSFYKLPRVLQWFSGNIGFHHIHHLSPRIPNYNLEPCHKAAPMFQAVKPVTLVSSLKAVTFRLWDEQCQRLVGFGYLRTVRRQRP